MTAQTKTILKGYFNIGDKLSETNFVDFIDSLSGRYYSRLVAASNAPADVIAQADYVCDGIDDDVQIQAALDDLTGGIILLSIGTFTIAAEATITIGTNEKLVGSGNATIITRVAAGDAPWIVMGNDTSIERLHVTLVYQGTSSAAIRCWNVSNIILRDLFISGGTNQASVYAISLHNTMVNHCDNILIETACSGWEIIISTPLHDYEWGNGIFNHCEVHNSVTGSIGWHIAGAGARTYNLMQFNACFAACLPANAAGSIGWKIDNCQFLTLCGCHTEGADTALSINGLVAGGRTTKAIVFVNIYVNGAINIDSNSYSTVFLGGILDGVLTDNQVTAKKKTRYIGVFNSSYEQIPDNPDGE